MKEDTRAPSTAPDTQRPRDGRTGLRALALGLALITTGLSAGFFYAWQVGSIPGFRLLDDATYIRTMNAVNSTIRNPGFASIFFGSAVFMLAALLSRAAARETRWRPLAFGLLGAACALYIVGVMGITFTVHVPLNTDLLGYTDLSGVDAAAIRTRYQTRWNTWHLVRTYAAVGSFVLLLGALFVERTPHQR